MVNCRVEYNKDGTIDKVLDSAGNESNLFKDISQLPFVDTKEDALEIYKQNQQFEVVEQIELPVQFQKTQSQNKSQEGLQEVLTQVKKTGLADNIYQLTNQEIQAKLIELGVDPDVLKQIVGERGANNLDTVNKTNLTIRLEEAIELEKQGVTPQKILLATAWQRGADNKWRHEIPDGEVSIPQPDYNTYHEIFEGNVSEHKLSDVYKNEELYKAYPELKETKVIIYKPGNTPQVDNIPMFEYQNNIYINEKREEVQGGVFKYTLPTLLLHESQHLIQNIEGFAKGTSTERYRSEIEEFIRKIKRGDVSLPKGMLQGRGLQPEDRITKEAISIYGLEELESINSGDTVFNEALREDFISRIAYRLYEKSAGEVEARNVQKRADMSAEKRDKTLLAETEDIPRSKQRLNYQKQLQEKGITLTTTGFIHKNDVYINKDTATAETAIHEYHHLFNKYLKKNKPELYKKGISLIEAELNKSRFSLPDFSIFSHLVPTKELDKVKEFSRDKPLRGEDYYQTLKEDIRRNGIRTPITIIEQGGKMIINEGNHRLRAAKELGIENIPVKISGYSMSKEQLEKAPNAIDIRMYAFTLPQMQRRENFINNKSVKSEIQNIIDFVERTQPKLKGEAKTEEILTQLLGEKGIELINSKKKSGIKDWLKDVWNQIKDMLGLSDYSLEDVLNMDLDQYAEARNVELLKGNNIDYGSNKKTDGSYQETPEQARRRRGRWDEGRGPQTLEGAPRYKRSKGAIPELVTLAEEYAEANNIPYKRQSKYVEVDPNRAVRIMQAYDEMEHNPQDPTVKEAYANLIEQTKAQYQVLMDAGYQFYFFDETNDPYEGRPVRAMVELREDRKMGSFATEAGFGSGNEGLDVSDNPLLEDTGLTWGFGSTEGKQKRVLANDLFRAVHDAFGHGLEGAGFRARGEENAWQAHARLFTGSAVAAITSETRGQNSWLNFHPVHGLANKTASVADTVFAPQKTGLMPEWTWKEGFDEGQQTTSLQQENITVQQAVERNNGYPMSKTSNGKESKLYKDILSLPEVNGNTQKADEIKAKTYSDNFKDWFGDWFKYRPKKDNNKVVLFNSRSLNTKLVNATAQDTFRAVENYADISIHQLSPTVQELRVFEEKVGRLVDNEEFNYDLMEEDYGVTEKDVQKLLNRVESKLYKVEANSYKLNEDSTVSKVVDENGEPLMVYNGSSTERYELKGFGGIWTSPSKVDVENFLISVRGVKKKDIKMRPSFVSIKTPEVFEDFWHRGYLDEVSKTFDGDRDKFKDFLSTKGKDGIFIEELSWNDDSDFSKRSNSVQRVVFNPNQIKSVFNEGQFSEKTDDIRYQKTEVTGNKLSYKANNKTTESFREALQENTEIEVGIETKEGFKTVATIPNNTNPNTKEGFINSYVKQGVIQEKKYEYKGKTYIVPEGGDMVHRYINKLILQDDLGIHLGRSSYEQKDGLFTVKEKPTTKIISKRFKDVAKAISEEIVQESGVELETEEKPQLDETTLSLKLLNILNKLGIDTLSIANYIEKFKIKYGVEPSATALADIANRVVAFKNGDITIEDLTEETMHFIVEALPAELTENLRRNIHRTAEYQQFSEHYREIYTRENPNKTKEEIEHMVRQEILGKLFKNATLSRLNKEHTTKNFYDRAVDAIREFFNRVFGVKNYESELSQINDLVEDLIIKDSLDIINEKNIDADYRLYNAQSTYNDRDVDMLRVFNKDLSASLEKSLKSLKRAGSNVSYDTEKIRLLRANLETATQAEAVLNQVSAAHNVVRFVKKGIEVSEANGKMLGLKERQAFQEMTITALPLLTAIKESVSRKKPNELGISEEENQKEVKDKLLNKLDELITEINSLTGKQGIAQKVVFEQVVDRMMTRFELPSSYKGIVEQQLNEIDSELNVLMYMFGQMNNTSDTLLTMASGLIEEMYSNQKEEEQQVLRDFTNKLEELGITPAQLKELFKDGHILSKWDFKKFNSEVTKIEFEERQRYFPNETLEEYTKNKSKNSFEVVPTENQDEYWGEVQARINEEIEKPNNIEHYTKKAKKFKDLNISLETIRILNSISSDRGAIYNKSIDSNNKIHLTEEDNAVMNALSHQRKVAKDIFNEAGYLKAGILETIERPSTLPQGMLQESSGVYYDIESGVNILKRNNIYYVLEQGASVEATTSFDLHRFDQSFIDEKKENPENFEIDKDALLGSETMKGKLIELLEEEGEDAVIDFIENNIGVSFTSDFWDSMNVDTNTLETYENDVEYRNIVFNIRKNQNRLSALKKRQQDNQNPSEVNGHEMLKSHREEIKFLTEKIASDYSSLPREESFEKSESPAIKETNNAYTQHLIEKEVERGSIEEYEIIKENVTSKNSELISSERTSARAFDRGHFFRGSKRLKERLDEIKEGKDISYEEAYLEIARTKLLSYFVRTTPKNYKSLKEIISLGRKNNDSSAEIMVNLTNQLFVIKEDPNFELNVNFSYSKKKNDESRNPDYDKGFIGGVYQPKLSKYANQDYINMFAPDSEGKATRNQALFEALQTVVEAKKDAHDRMEVSSAQNVYKAPQISRTNTDKLSNLFKGETKKNFGEIIKDAFQHRIDDLEYGETNSVGQLEIPKLYVRDLERKEDVSDDLYFTMLQFMSQSTLYKARRNALSDLHAVEEKIAARSTPDKEAVATNNYKLFKSNLEYHVFGVKEQKKLVVDLTSVGLSKLDVVPIIRGIHKLVKFRNLAQNVTIPLTSLVTAKVNWFIEGKINEYVSPEAMRMAKSEFRNSWRDTAKNALEYNDKSKMNLYGEFVGLYDMTDRARNAKFGKGKRFLGKASMVFHNIGNFPIIPKLMLATMMDYRVVNGRMVNKATFYKQATRQGKTNKEIDMLWSNYKEDNLYNFLEIKDNKVQISDKIYEKFPNITKKNVEDSVQAMRFAVKDRQQKIDGQIPQSQRLAAQRHYLWNFFTTHMGWFYIATQKRFKGLNANIENRQLEMGTYTAAGKMLMNTIGELGNYNYNIVKAYREVKKNPKSFDIKKVLGFEVTKEQFKNQAEGILPKSTLDKIKPNFDLYEVQKEVEFQIDKLVHENKLDQKEAKQLRDTMDKLVQTEDFNDEAVNLMSRTQKRIQVETAVLLAVGAIAYAISMAADDDELKRNSPAISKVLGWSAYILERTAVETKSGQVGLPTEFVKQMKGQGIVGMNHISNIVNVSEMFSGDKVKQGPYRGYSEASRYWTRLIPIANEYYKYKHIDRTRSTYRVFNETTFQKVLDYLVE